ncbi:hypothetical protein PLICRDRAFT_171314 [Plicaturopsis crispa FD-325 SS-3]|nr:hypothetical protein PLICRDRAFT_171314 [Plicaturopsis crispa FD-325 SS-3]
MKLDATDLRYVTSDEFRVLTAVEMGSKNHEVVPTSLVAQISGLRNGGVNKLIGALAKRNLVSKVQNSKYDGYRLTYGGYDYLAMRAMSKRDSLYSVGNQIGVGKESDIYIVADAEGKEMVLKLHRLGRISFRAIKEKRDYLGKRKSASWMYMSRLAAQKEWAFMKVLHEHGFPVPRPIDQARHTILMEFIDAYPLRQIASVPSPGKLYSALMDLIVRFAHAGLIHGDFNEFNILIRRDYDESAPSTSTPADASTSTPADPSTSTSEQDPTSRDPALPQIIIIDFPQMVSTSHANAEYYFNRDVECIRAFFRRRFRYESKVYPRFARTVREGIDGEGEEGREDGGKEGGEGFRLDVVVAASGFGRREEKVLEEYMEQVKAEEPQDEDEDEDSSEEGDEDRDEDEDEEVRGEQEGEILLDQDTKMDTAPPLDADPQASTSQLPTNLPTSPPPSIPTPASPISSTSSTRLRNLSRSPPASRSPSPDSLEKMTAALSLRDNNHLRDTVSSDIARSRAREQRKHHSKRGARRVGRPMGSKAKQDTRVKVDSSGMWD